MNINDIRIAGITLAELLSVLLPLFAVFFKDIRFSIGKTTGILAGYLLFSCTAAAAAHHLWGDIFPYLQLLIVCTMMAGNVLLGRFLMKTQLQVTVYTLFLFENFSTCATALAILAEAFTAAPATEVARVVTDLIYRFSFQFLIAWSSCSLLSLFLVEAVEYSRLMTVWQPLTAIPVIFFIMGMLSLPVSLSGSPPQAGRVLLTVCWLICLYTVHYVSLRILASLSQSYAIREQYRTTRLLISAQTSQMLHLQATLEQLMKTRHDFRHHLVTLLGLLENHQTDEALSYVNEYLGSSEYFANIRYCESSPTNALLNYYLQSAKEHHIQVAANISLPQPLPLPEIDFCTILGNLLSNALEACLRQKSGQTTISVNIGHAGSSMITMSIRNSYTHEIREKNGRFLSSKDGGEGMGTISVRCLVDRYRGVLKYQYGNGIFEASVLLNPKMA